MVAESRVASTRETYGKVLAELGKKHPEIVVLGGDLNKSTFTYLFAAQFPDRFFDFGPAEQNIMGVAAGLASSGKTPFVSTFAVFGTCRPFDQIRVSIASAPSERKDSMHPLGHPYGGGRHVGPGHRGPQPDVLPAGIYRGGPCRRRGDWKCGPRCRGELGAGLHTPLPARNSGAPRGWLRLQAGTGRDNAHGPRCHHNRDWHRSIVGLAGRRGPSCRRGKLPGYQHAHPEARRPGYGTCSGGRKPAPS